jgi:hypothetical protein
LKRLPSRLRDLYARDLDRSAAYAFDAGDGEPGRDQFINSARRTVDLFTPAASAACCRL